MCICGGSGGVGKTTTSAAIALGMAARGAKVAVVTIDPARRLASAMGKLGTVGARPADRLAIHLCGSGRAQPFHPSVNALDVGRYARVTVI